MISMPRAKKAEPGRYGQNKKNYSFMLTPDCSAMVDAMCERLQLTRSEFVELVMRGLNEQSSNFDQLMIKLGVTGEEP